ncbi:Putative ammonium transporter 3 [Eumeta japonica]|uniref:Ammonium transporter 3 n=1 Tax=Eumeta variegata TaxID=151549 RepID=A0A4C1ZRX7_EUMVA|nr:Putative ammonium transporter 3 [Eumeta japonica]
MDINSTLNAPAALRSSNSSNSSSHLQANFEIDLEDTNWILTSSFIIFTMQTGFGMLESGCVSVKNEANIMMKNLADISLGGLTYWIFGYGMSFGQGPYTNPFVGLGDFLVDPPVGDELMGPVLASFLFQLSFATTATTIVSGAMAERCNFKAYCLFSSLNTVVYCVPAGWVWGGHGFLGRLGAVDIAGSGPVHLIGGASALASALMLGPRLGRYARGSKPLPLGNPVNAVMGTFVLWWGWLAFNSGSTYGVGVEIKKTLIIDNDQKLMIQGLCLKANRRKALKNFEEANNSLDRAMRDCPCNFLGSKLLHRSQVSGAKWQYAARAAVMTMMGSFGGGCFGLVIMPWPIWQQRKNGPVRSVKCHTFTKHGREAAPLLPFVQQARVPVVQYALHHPNPSSSILPHQTSYTYPRGQQRTGDSSNYTLVKNKGRADVMELINSILGSLVSITAGCFLYRAWEALLVGATGAMLVCLVAPLFDRCGVDDPVSASAVHGVGGIWGNHWSFEVAVSEKNSLEHLRSNIVLTTLEQLMRSYSTAARHSADSRPHLQSDRAFIRVVSILPSCVIAVGIFADNPIPMDTTNGRSGLFKSGDWYLLGVQSLTVLCLTTWGLLSTIALLWFIDLILPIRMDPYEELLGADLTEHRIRHGQVGVSRAVSALRLYHRSGSVEDVGAIGVNTGHAIFVDRIIEARINGSKSKKRLSNAFQRFTNHIRATNDEDGERKDNYSFGQKSRGFLNKRPGNPTNGLHSTIDTITRELEREGRTRNKPRDATASANELGEKGEFKNRETFSRNSPTFQSELDPEREYMFENLKNVKYKDLTVSDLEYLSDINSTEDRFRHKLNQADYEDDIKRANLRWID